MNEILKEMKQGNYDVFTFFPGEKEHQVLIQGNSYKDPGEKLDYNDTGDCYHIILFKENGEIIEQLDRYDAILTSPVDYLSMLMEQDWYGAIFRKTTTSDAISQKLFDNLTQSC